MSMPIPLCAPADGLPRLMQGQVMHHRLHPASNHFVYPVFYALLPMQHPERLTNAWFALNRRHWLGLDFHDYGRRDGSNPLDWLRAQLAPAGLAGLVDSGQIWLQTFPRVLGYVFNPVSFWFCHDHTGQLHAVLAEVSNTFGERHSYLLHHPDHRPICTGEVLTADKRFHVSPFFPVVGEYRFTFSAAGDRAFPCRVAIDYSDKRGKALLTAIRGEPEVWNTTTLRRVFWRFPLLTVGVIARIHWQALKLWWKKVPFFRHPSPGPQVR